MPELLPQMSYYQDNETQTTQIARLELGSIVNPGKIMTTFIALNK